MNPTDYSHNHYRVRQQALLEIGFQTYKEYLKSALWESIRDAVLEAHSHQCRACGRTAYTVHHVTYTSRVLLGKDRSQLIPICRACHKAIETKDGWKRRDANEIARALSYRAMRCGRGKRFGRKFNPKCRCCLKAKKAIGREGICLDCYKRYREHVHERVKQIESQP